jgi:hypothetical protein
MNGNILWEKGHDKKLLSKNGSKLESSIQG